MKLGFQIGDEFLDLRPDTTVELEENNPFLTFDDDQQLGTYSIPFTADDTPKNRRLTRYASVYQAIVDNAGIDARAINLGLQHSFGKIKIEKPSFNLNKNKIGSISMYYLIGASSFYQDVKDKRLRDANLGGDRSFAYDDPNGSGTGFWNHITTLARSGPNVDDYAIFPVINKGWPSGIFPDAIEVMNDTGFTAGQIIIRTFWATVGMLDLTRIVPFPYLHYVLKKAVEYVGWSMEGTILDDDDFKKITMLNAQAIDWGYAYKFGGNWTIAHRDPVVFNLKNSMPDIGISELLIAIRKRFGLYYDFDYINKKVIVYKLDDQLQATPKDMTKFASPLIDKPIKNEKKIYALRNEFTIGGGDSPDLTNISFQGNLNQKTDLPAAIQALYAQVYLIVGENNYYICLQNETTEAWEWQLFSYNIFDHVPADSNDSVVTKATTVGVEKYTRTGTVGGSPIPGMPLLPRFDINGKWFGRTDSSTEEEWGIHLCFYHGPTSDLDGRMYPYGSSHIYDPGLAQVAQWGLPFDCYKADGSNVGVYERYWKNFLNMINNIETFECKLYLPFYEFLKLKVTDQIIIDGVKMFVSKIKPKLPYEGFVDLECVRIT